MKKILFLFLVAGIFYACKKDNIGSKPILSFNGYTADSVTERTDVMYVIMNIEDGDGDIEDSLWIAPIIDSQAPDTFFIPKRMPAIGANKGNKIKGDIQIKMEAIDLKTAGTKPITPNDSIHFEVFIRDNAGHFSDTIFTPKIPYRVKA